MWLQGTLVRELLKESVKARKEEDIDSEMEDLIDAYSIEEGEEWAGYFWGYF